MPTKHNLMVKVLDARAGEIQKILKAAGVQVISVIEVHKEEVPAAAPDTPTEAEKK
ncbi:MAG: hypothetical protein Kow0099_04320 [Candidatus Abyssubacteria bacterium]